MKSKLDTTPTKIPVNSKISKLDEKELEKAPKQEIPKDLIIPRFVQQIV